MTDLMTIEQTALLLAKVQLIDNREVSKLVIREWHDILAEQVTFDQAVDAVKRFRQERPGVYLEPGHLIEMAEPNYALLGIDGDAEWDAELDRRAREISE